MSDDVARTAIVFDATQAKSGADDVQASGQKIIASNDAVVASEQKTAGAVEQAEGRKVTARQAAALAAKSATSDAIVAAAAEAGVVATATDRIVTSLSNKTRFLDQTSRAYAPLSAAVQKTQNDIARLTAIIDAGNLTDERAAQAAANLAGAKAKLQIVSKALADSQQVEGAALSGAAGAIGTMASVARSTGKDLENLATSHDHVTGGSNRMREAMVLVHETLSGNYKRAVGSATIELQNFGLMQTVLTTLMNPFLLATVAAVAAFTVLELHYEANQTQARQLGVALDTLGRNSADAVQNLQSLGRGLRDSGVAAADVNTILLEIARNPALNQSGAGSIAQIGLDLAAFQGKTAAEGVKEFADALSGGVASVVKLGLSLNAFSADELVSIDDMKRHGDQAGALNRAIGDIGVALLGNGHKATSDAAGQAHNLTAAWGDLLDKLTDSSGFKAVHDGLTQMVKDLTAVITTGSVPLNSTLGRLLSLIPGAGGIAIATGVIANPFPGPNLSLTAPTSATGTAPGGMRIVSPNGREFDGLQTGLQTGGALTGGLAVPIDSLVQAIVQVESGGNPNAVSSAGAMGLMQLMPGTAAGLGVTNPFDGAQNVAAGTAYIQQLISKYDGNVQTALMAYNWGPGNVDQYLAGQKALPTGVANYPGAVLSKLQGLPSSADIQGLSAGVAGSGSQPLLTMADPVQAAASTEAIDKMNAATQNAVSLLQQFGIQQEATRAKQEAFTAAIDTGRTPQRALDGAPVAYTDAMAKASAEIAHQNALQDLQTKGALDAATAYGTSEVAGIPAALAKAQAVLDVAEGRTTDVATAYDPILVTQAVSAINAGAKANAAMVPQIAAQQRLADAASQGTAALHEQEVTNQAVASTQNALTDAQATGNRTLIAQAQAIQDAAVQKAHYLDLLKQETSLYQDAANNNNQIQVLQLEASLQGQTSEAIQAQVELLQKKLAIQASNVPLDNKAAQADLASVAALGQQKEALADIQREWGLVNSAVQSIGSDIDNGITQNLQNAFSGTAITSWGTVVHQVLGQIEAQLISLTLIKPAIGSVLSALGLAQAAQSFGSFGSLAGLFGGSSTSGNGTITLTGTDSSGNPITLSNAASAASLASGTGIFGSAGGFTSWLNGLGTNLGFAGSGIVNGTGAGAGIYTNLATGATSDVAGSGVASGLFGGTTLGGFLGGAGTGLAAGSILNQLVGGNTLGGTVGSGVGGLAGAAIGSLLLPGIGTLLGGLIGGAGGGVLGGLFGPGPSGQSSGTVLDLASGAVTQSQSSGNSQNDATVSQLTTTLQSFAQSLMSASGGTLVGAINPTADTNSGPAVNYAGTLIGSGKVTGSVDQIVSTVEQGMLKDLTGLSTTMQTVLSQLTDPSQVQAATAFATAYDSLKTAADSAFQSVNDTTDQIGPYATALNQINATFATLTANAQQFGLSLAPVNAGLAEATQRLTQDFNTNVAQLTQAMTDPLGLAIAQAKTAGTALVADATAVGGDQVAVAKYNSLQLEQIWDQQTQSLQQLATDLTSGSLSSATGAQTASAANDNFNRELGLVQGGNTAELNNLATAGSAAVSAYQSAYGNGPQTTAIQNAVLQAVDQVLANRSFASGTMSTPPGLILVGENGPELLRQPGGAQIYPNGTVPAGASSDSGALIAEVRGMRNEIATLRTQLLKVTQAIGAQTIDNLKAVRDNTGKPPKPIAAPPRSRVAA